MWYRQNDDHVTANIMFELAQSFAARCGDLVLACIDGTISERELATRLADEAGQQQYMQSIVRWITVEWNGVYDQGIANVCRDRGVDEARRSVLPVILSLTEDHSDLITLGHHDSAHELLEAVEFWQDGGDGDLGDVSFLECMGRQVLAYCAEDDAFKSCFRPGQLVDLLLRQ